MTTQVIGVRDLYEAQGSSDTHPSPTDTLTRLTLPPESVLTLPAGLAPTSDPDGLVWWEDRKKGQTTQVIGERDLLEAQGSSSSDTHPSPSDILTRLTLHLNQF